MNKETFYFKHLDIPINQQELDSFDAATNLRGDFFKLIDLEFSKEHLPTIFKWFDTVDLRPIVICSIGCSSGRIQDLHRDYSDRSLALNVLVTPEAQDSVTRFYELKDNVTPVVNHIPSSGLPYIKFKERDVRFVTSYKPTKPVLLNIHKIHSVVNHTLSRRVMISFRFEKDPWHLI